jgi:hypothetical protein
VFDDTPVHARRPVTAGDLRALRTVSREADQLYLVLSVEAGPQVLTLTVLEQRVAAGGRYVVVASAADLPDALLAARGEELTAAEPDDAPVWLPRVHDSRHPDFGHWLGTAEGERLTVRLARSFHDPDAALRSLVLARDVTDLRTLGHDWNRDQSPRGPLPSHVWHGLLAMDQLDLEPFLPAPEDQWSDGDGLPLGILADVQLYSTDARGRYEGRGHTPECQHNRDRHGLSRDDDMVTVEQMLQTKRFNPCSKCGGYATRRLTTRQVTYYRAAHQLRRLAEDARRMLQQEDPGASLAPLLVKVERWDETPVCDDWFAEPWELRLWSRFVRRFRMRLQAAADRHEQRS